MTTTKTKMVGGDHHLKMPEQPWTRHNPRHPVELTRAWRCVQGMIEGLEA